MENEMEFSLAKMYPQERRYIILKPLNRSFINAVMDNIFKRK